MTGQGIHMGLEPDPSRTGVLSRRGDRRLMLFGGRTSMELAGKIAGWLDIDLGKAELKTFANGEVYCRYEESVRGSDLFIVQSTASNPVRGLTTNDSLMELLVMIDAAIGASAHRVTAVIPWYGYSRQDKKSAPREPISARLVAKMLETAGVNRVVTMDLHAGQEQGYFTKVVDHMTALPMLTNYCLDGGFADGGVVVAPDVGRVKLNKKFADRIHADLAILVKERPAHQVAEIAHIIGDVKGRTAIIVDDIIDTAGTLCAAAEAVLDAGAERVIALATHAVLSEPAIERLESSPIERIAVTDTIPHVDLPPKIEVLSAASIFGDTIRRVFLDDSVSEIFAGDNILF